MAETATKKTETVKPEEKKQEDKKPATKTAAAKESAKKEETKADKKETKPAAAKKEDKKDVTSADKSKEEKPAEPAVKAATKTVDEELTDKVPENKEKSEEIKKEEVKAERTMFQLKLLRRIAMYMHPTFNSACRMIEGTVICKSDKSVNGWLTIYTGIPEIGKVTGYIRTESLGWR